VNSEQYADSCGTRRQANKAKTLGDGGSKIRKTMKRISISRDPFSITGVDVCQRAEAIDLHFIDELVGIERFSAV
jgi:hypothetical protein